MKSSKNTDSEAILTETALIGQILDLARWAPSGDNTQPWRFEVKSENHLVVRGFDTRRKVVYDLQGHASHIAIGVLLEYISIAASTYGLKTHTTYQDPVEVPDEHPRFDVRFSEDSSISTDPLFPFLKTRSVNRRPLGTAPLTPEEKESIARAMGPNHSPYRVEWLEGLSNRVRMAHITQSSGKLRLTLPEAYEVHRTVIKWNARFSEDRIPDQALGLSSSILPLMHWIMESWSRVSFFNRYLGGTLIPRLQLDILPALFCSAHFVLLAPLPPKVLMDYVAAGRTLGRLWLGVSEQGLHLQPEMTPLIFRTYASQGISFSTTPFSMMSARKIASSIDRLLGPESSERAVFIGRVGRGNTPQSRSLRLPLNKLFTSGQPSD
ncbi:MAG: nitroreductase family protein [Leptospirales bacterium]